MGTRVDVRGLSCPQPVMLTRKALQQASGDEVIVLADTMTQVDNCSRTAEALGWKVSCEKTEDALELILRRGTTDVWVPQ